MARIKRTLNRARNTIGTTERPRLAVHRSLKHISVQVIDDQKQITIAAAISGKTEKNNLDTAKKVGLLIAEKAKAAGVKNVVFDRRRYLYHGRVKALADGAREGGLNF